MKRGKKRYWLLVKNYDISLATAKWTPGNCTSSLSNTSWSAGKIPVDKRWLWHYDTNLEYKFCAWGETTSHRDILSELLNKETWKKGFDGRSPRNTKDTCPKWGGDFCLGVYVP